MKAETVSTLPLSQWRMDCLFRRQSVTEVVRRVWHGLHQPRDTGAYRYAKLQVTRLWSPTLAVLVPVLAIALFTWLASLRPATPDSVAAVIMKTEEQKEIVLDDKPEPLDDPTPKIDDKLVDVPMDDPVVTTQEPEPIVDVIKPMVNLNPVLPTKSFVFMPGIYEKRTGPRDGRGVPGGGGGAETDEAVLRALRWLKKHQESDGAWRGESGGKQEGRHSTGNAPAMTGLALLTFLAHGETPASEEFGHTVERAMRWLAANQEEDGRFKGRDGHDYCLPIAAYALCEGYGMTQVPVLRDAAERSIDVIVRGQHRTGGWDYNCKRSERNDLSYSGWCVQALKAAAVAGLSNPELHKALRLAARGVKANAHPSGGFGYTGPGQSHLTSVGVLCLQMTGEGQSPEARAGLEWLQRATCEWSAPWGRNPLYYWYYVTQAQYREGGRMWETWNAQFAPELCANQTVLAGAGLDGKDIGYWASPGPDEHCRSLVYNTTLCALTLQVYYRTGGKGLMTFERVEREDASSVASPDDVVPVIVL